MSARTQSNKAPLSIVNVPGAKVDAGTTWTPEKAERAAANNVYLFYGQPEGREGARRGAKKLSKKASGKAQSKSSTNFRSFRGAERAMAKGIIYIPSILVAGKQADVEQVLMDSPEFIAWAQKNIPGSSRFNQSNVKSFVDNNAIKQDNYLTSKNALYRQEIDRFYRLLNTPKGAYATWAKAMQVNDVDSYWQAISSLADMIDKSEFDFVARKKAVPDENKYARNEALLKDRYNKMEAGKVLNVSDLDPNSLVGAAVTSVSKIMTKGDNPTVKPSMYYDANSALVSNNLENFAFAYNLLVPGAPSVDQLTSQYASAFAGLTVRKGKKAASTKKASTKKVASAKKKSAAKTKKTPSKKASTSGSKQASPPTGARGFGAAPAKAPGKSAARKVGSTGGAAASSGKKAAAKSGAASGKKAAAKGKAAAANPLRKLSVGRATPQTSPKSPGLTRVPPRQPSVGRTQAQQLPEISDEELRTFQPPPLRTTGATRTGAFMPPSRQ